MIVRLANVIYWLCTAIAVILVGFGLYDMSQEMGADKFWAIGFVGVMSSGIWSIGLAARYIHRGR
jgi:hypothetical protein